MCGILGVVGNLEVSKSLLLDSIRHRGPDFQDSIDADNLLLCHSRLSIQDLSEQGNQPMRDTSGNYVIIFNGEIYNHWELRPALEEMGYVFRSTSDTETLLYSYIEYGSDCLQELNGIFAFCIYDKGRNTLFIARDQLGVKPLYFFKGESAFYFSSEIKSFLHLPIPTSVDKRAILNYLTFLWSPGDRTPFKDVKKLKAGHFIQLDIATGEVELERYYKVPFNGQRVTLPESQMVDKLDEILRKAVKRQLLSDVPVGFFLSGGLDSSLLVAIAKRIDPSQRFPCFTIDPGKSNADEGFVDDVHYARMVADHLDVELNVIPISSDIVRDFDKMIWHLDEPQADPAPLNVLTIARAARDRGIKVLIGGTAGDDLFSGYRRHQAIQYEKYFKCTPGFVGALLHSLLSFVSSSSPTVRRMAKLSKDLDKDQITRLAGYFKWISHNACLELLPDNPSSDPYDPGDYFFQLLKEIPDERDVLNQMLYWELNTFLVDHNLNYTDKMSMAVGVETRVPYLDLELVEFATKIPPELKMKGSETKYILKKVAERYLPKEVIYRPKTGFGAPVRSWIKNEMADFITERLNAERVSRRGIFAADKVSDLIKRNRQDKIDASYTIWSLLAIDSWMNQFLDQVHETNHSKPEVR